MRIGTIVAALALETDNDAVAARAAQLASRHGARLIFVHVIEEAIPDGWPGSPDVAALRGMLERNASDRIEQMIGDCAPDVAKEIVVRTGKPYKVIDEVVKQEDADLVVIGPGKARSVREKVFGSTADRIVRSSSRPVLIVRSSTADAYRHLVMAVDFSAASRAAANAAMSLAPDAAVELVHAVEIPLGFEQAMLKAGTPQEEIERHRRARAVEARRQISASLEEWDFPGSRPRLRIFHGAASQVLVRLSRSRRTDLMALGTQGSNAISQAFLGSVARHVLRAAGCDLLVSP